MMKEAADMEAVRTPKRRRSARFSDQVPSGGDSGQVQGSLGDLDLIIRLPNVVIVTIISLLPTKDGARTQALARRWRPLWCSSNTPLNLVADSNLCGSNLRVALVSRILRDHHGPTRCFSIHLIFSPNILGEVGDWFLSMALNGLQDLEVTNLERNHYLLPPHAISRFAPTLRVLSLSGCQFPDMVKPPSFPCLKQLILYAVIILGDSLQNMISSCVVLESVSLHNMGFSRLCISSPTLRSIGFYAPISNDIITFHELVIEDAPCLERLLPIYSDDGPGTIRVIRAPKLEVIGLLSEGISALHLGTTVFKKMIATSLTTKMYTMKILFLGSIGPNLAAIIDFLKCFPCLEKLYVNVNPYKVINNMRTHDPLDPVQCLELHLKNVVLKTYYGENRPFIDIANFILNAKVLQEMEIRGLYSNNTEKMHYLHKLQIENRASKDAQIELKSHMETEFRHHVHTHDLSIVDPFEKPVSGCSKCAG